MIDELRWLREVLDDAGEGALDVSSYYGPTTSRGRAFAAVGACIDELLAVVEASRDPEFCEDHADNCCEEWCATCQASEAWWMRLARAHDDLDAAIRRSRDGAR